TIKEVAASGVPPLPQARLADRVIGSAAALRLRRTPGREAPFQLRVRSFGRWAGACGGQVAQLGFAKAVSGISTLCFTSVNRTLNPTSAGLGRRMEKGTLMPSTSR